MFFQFAHGPFQKGGNKNGTPLFPLKIAGFGGDEVGIFDTPKSGSKKGVLK